MGSIATWRTAKGSGDSAHAERFGIFVGLWAPTFFALAGQVAIAEANDAKAIGQNSWRDRDSTGSYRELQR